MNIEIRTGFSCEWESQYSQNQHLSVFPWTDVVSYVHRYAQPSKGFTKVLELGCGAGANISLFEKLNMDYYGIDGSSSIITKLHEKYPGISQRLAQGDFTKELPFEDGFDLVLDRASVTHNSTSDILNTLTLVNSKLRSNGLFIGFDWFSEEHSDFQKGTRVDDFTRREIPSGTLKGTGNVHFSTKEHLEDIFNRSGFKVELLEKKSSKFVIGDTSSIFGAWNLIAIKVKDV